MEIIQVSATSPTSAVAQAISSVIYEYHCAEVEVLGAEALQQARQALSLATAILKSDGIGLTCVSERKKVIVDNRLITLITLMLTATTTRSLSPISASNAPFKAKDLPRA